jgi:hypothetical protein
MSNETKATETITEWCAKERMSKASFYSLLRANPELAPKTITIPNTRIIRVIESHEDWRARVADLARSADAQLEAARRREIASIAGKAAIKSPKHITRRQKSGRARRVRG